MENNKSSGNDKPSKEFYECLWDEIKKPFLVSKSGIQRFSKACSDQNLGEKRQRQEIHYELEADITA